MKFIITKRPVWLCVTLLVLTVISCKKDDEITDKDSEDTSSETTKAKPTYLTKIYDQFKKTYLWRDQLPNVQPEKYSGGKTLLDKILYKQVDKWSHFKGAIDINKHNANISTAWPMRVRLYVDEDSIVARISNPIANKKYAKDLQKGMEVYKFNGQKIRVGYADYQADKSVIDPFINAFYEDETATTMELELRTYDLSAVPISHTTKTMTITREEYAEDPLPTTWAKDIGGVKLGYLRLTTFVGKDYGYHIIKSLEETLRDFSSKGVTTLIVDLRDNGGGYSIVSSAFANMLIPSAKKDNFVSGRKNSFETEVTSKFTSSSRVAFDDAQTLVHDFANVPPLANQLQKIYFFVNSNTASASETLMLYTTPYVSYELIGENTVGKLVGGPVLGFDDEKKTKQYFYIIDSRAVNGKGESKFTPWEPKKENEAEDRAKYADTDLNMPFTERVLQIEGKVSAPSKKILTRQRTVNLPDFGKKKQNYELIYRE